MVFFVFVFFCVSLFGVSADDSNDPAAVATIEDLYLQQLPSLESVGTLVRSDDYATQMIGVRVLRKGVETGVYDPDDPLFTDAAGAALSSGVSIISNNRSRLPDSYYPNVRIAGAKALALSRNKAARQHLLNALRNDPEPSVQSAVADALADRADGFDSLVAFTLSRALHANLHAQPDPAFLISGLNALDRVFSYHTNEAFDDAVVTTVYDIATSGLERSVRERAIAVYRHF